MTLCYQNRFRMNRRRKKVAPCQFPRILPSPNTSQECTGFEKRAPFADWREDVGRYNMKESPRNRLDSRNALRPVLSLVATLSIREGVHPIHLIPKTCDEWLQHISVYRHGRVFGELEQLAKRLALLPIHRLDGFWEEEQLKSQRDHGHDCDCLLKY